MARQMSVQSNTTPVNQINIMKNNKRQTIAPYKAARMILNTEGILELDALEPQQRMANIAVPRRDGGGCWR